jgi:hypothetical protein
MTKKYILINGAIRDVDEFSLIIDYIFFEKSSSDEDITLVVSTWAEDIQNNLSLFNWLVDNGTVVVSSPSVNVGGPANVFRQWKTLDAGLSVIPYDSFVLKGRTDKFLLRKDVIKSFINSNLSDSIVSYIIDNNILCVEHFSVTLPFMAKDMIYLGTPSAIRKTTSFSVRTQYLADHIFNGIGPECFLWLELASKDHTLMQLIQCLDFRSISSSLVDMDIERPENWINMDKNISYLYKRWIEIFDSELSFLSDILGCRKADTWRIDEGSWSYKTGDREEFEKIRKCISSIDDRLFNRLNLSHDDVSFINSISIFKKKIDVESHLEVPFPDRINEIRQSFLRENSDIVLIRNSIIESELSSPSRSKDVMKALHWNIRQRDRATLERVYDWLINNDTNIKLVNGDDCLFVIERKIDMFTFQQDNESIETAILKLRHYFIMSPILLVRLGEYFFHKRHLYKAAYYFWKAQRGLPNDLGANHGLGCVLLDLGYARLSTRYLEKAHKIMPSDQTATFTLLRAHLVCKNINKVRMLLSELSGHMRVEAEKIVNV